MARTLYSQRFFSHGALVPGTYTQLVPSGLRYVLRDLDVVNLTTGSGVVDMGLTGDAGQFIWYLSVSSPAAATHYQWQGRQILDEEEPFGIVVFHGNWDVTLSGYGLLLP